MKHRITIILALLFLSLSATLFAYGPFYIYPPDEGGSVYTWEDSTVNVYYVYYGEPKLSDTIPMTVKTGYATLCNNVSTTATVDELCNKYLSTCGVILCTKSLISSWENAELPLGDATTFVKVSDIKINFSDSYIALNSIGDSRQYFNQTSDPKSSENDIYILIDSTGSIIQEYYRMTENDSDLEIDASNIGAYAISEPVKDSSNRYFKKGYVIMNGKKSGAANYFAAFLHEMGHALGLDHTQPPLDMLTVDNSSESVTVKTGFEIYIPTMYPYLVESGEQWKLHNDDKIGLATLYPSDNFKNKFCAVQGILKSKSGTPYQGINLVAYMDTSQSTNYFSDSRSFVSGVLAPACSENGYFYLAGLIPGVPYHVEYQYVVKAFRNYTSGLNPYYEDLDCKLPPLNDSGIITTNDGNKEMVACNVSISGISSTERGSNGLLKAYETSSTVNSNTVYISDSSLIDLGDQKLGTNASEDPDDGTDTTKKGFCMSVAGGDISPLWGMMILATVAIIVVYRISRRKSQNL